MLRDLSQSLLFSGMLAAFALAGMPAVSVQPALAQTGNPCHLFTSAESIRQGFGAAYNLFLAAEELLLNVECGSSSNATLTVGNGQKTTYVYRFGYEWTGTQWKQISLGGTQLVANNWYVGTAEASLSRSQQQLTQDNFVLAYTCLWQNNSWKCGCRDTACTQHYWQLQAFRQTASSGGSGTCNTSVWNGTPCPPEPPRQYSLLSNAIGVSNSSELKSALSQTFARDIILADGTYDSSTYFSANAAHRLWAEHLGKAELLAGLSFRKGKGAEVHGLVFNINSEGKADGYSKGNAAIYAGGSAHGIKVTDSSFEGNGVVGFGVLVQAVDAGVELRRLVIHGFAHDGIRAQQPYTPEMSKRYDPDPPIMISDIDISDIVHPNPDCCNGTSESGIWIGNKAVIERVKVRDTDWMCLIPVFHANDIIWRDIDIDNCTTGIYIEHWTRNNVLERMHVGTNVRVGVNLEWGGNWGDQGVGPNNVIQDSVIESYRAGVNINVCNYGQTVQRVVFKNQCFAAILNSAGSDGYSGCPAATDNRFIDNNYSEIDAGAKTVSTAMVQSSRCQ